MMDAGPGGVAREPGPSCVAEVSALSAEIRRSFPELIELYDNTASLQDRTATTGILPGELARSSVPAATSGAPADVLDARKLPGYPLYDRLAFETPVLEAGDVNARVWCASARSSKALALIDQVLQALPDGAIRVDVASTGSLEGLGMAEAFRGDVLVVRLAGGRIARCHLRDPSWFQWPLLEAVIEGNIVADFLPRNKSSTAPIPDTTFREITACVGSLFESLLRRPLTEAPPVAGEETLADWVPASIVPLAAKAWP